ncbi:hypothetical protein BKP35_16385 [Anaerobacillus arseniciselenatis]|uniref:DNA repair protein Rad52 n=1 Tax=Anaerobacillus arseniciselenatis TaxID=85682 RepID=A0A1S2LAL6_9BACI|nr:Rad52/Rad22 family DNA repair protein [Anaerobacillus arseniciselenatis]OIJ09431.1 hypothetical protein BKP35_16385 [Anaerobacillus arseniciselenatis]
MKELHTDEVFQNLGAPFSSDEIEWRAQQVFEGKNGKPPKALIVPYVQSRAIMNRLDEVVGWDRWENVVEELPGGGILQGIRIWISETRSITKWDGADRTNIEATKGGISSAFKRAAVLLNIGRYLYSEDAKWVDITPQKATPSDEYISDKKKNIYGYFTPPSLVQKNQQRQHSPAQSKQSQPKEQQIPSGMIQCTFKKLVDYNTHLEVILSDGSGSKAVLFAIDGVKDRIRSLNFKDGDVLAVSTEKDGGGNFIINDVIKVAA